ncbi:hypothetical protein [Amycolatopsis sp. NPDC051903]|uniref:hypothetical protein n=1 Tax=Amycolatopsis sp. NPDC051903 TaxID=3363936 RepID=UPI003789D251
MANDTAYLAIFDGATSSLSPEPTSIKFSSALDPGPRLIALRDDVMRIIKGNEVSAVVVLLPESNYSMPYAKAVDRASLETLILLAAAECDISFRRVSRPRLRAELEISRSGKLAEIADGFQEAVGASWRGKRSLAALAARIAGGDQQWLSAVNY